MTNPAQRKSILRGISALVAIAFFALLSGVFYSSSSFAQESTAKKFIYGEKLTYRVSFDKFDNVAYAEMYVASNGTLGGKQTVELQGKIKTLDLFSAAFYLLDLTRTVYASEETGLPLFISDSSAVSGIPTETVVNYLEEPATALDLFTMIYKVRENGGAGSYTVLEKGKSYAFDFALTGGERVISQAGIFETNLSTVSSAYFDQFGVSNVRINFSADKKQVPVQFRFKTSRGDFTVLLAGSSVIQPEATPGSQTSPVSTPTPIQTPTPAPSPTPFVENQPLSQDLPFVLGEKLRFNVKQSGVDTGQIELLVAGRKQLGGEDSLIIKVGSRNSGSANTVPFKTSGEVWVDPFTLVPRKVDLRFDGVFASLNQNATFDQTSGIVVLENGSRVEVPIGTHSLLSFVYAIRSFNLYPSKDPKNPVNDTRVAVFANDQSYIFTLRPSAFERLDFSGTKIAAQQITILTGDPSLDFLNPRVWLSTDSRRIPLRILAGNFQADLIR